VKNGYKWEYVAHLASLEILGCMSLCVRTKSDPYPFCVWMKRMPVMPGDWLEAAGYQK